MYLEIYKKKITKIMPKNPKQMLYPGVYCKVFFSLHSFAYFIAINYISYEHFCIWILELFPIHILSKCNSFYRQKKNKHKWYCKLKTCKDPLKRF